MAKKIVLEKGKMEKVVEASSGITGGMSILSSWQVCHTLCTSAISMLAVVGIAVQGMPLVFLQKFSLPFWSAAVVMLLVVLLMKFKKFGCVSNKFLVLNSGLIVAGMPFKSFQEFSWLFLLAGFAIIAVAAVLHLKEKYKL